jgi:hypothetical protein
VARVPNKINSQAMPITITILYAKAPHDFSYTEDKRAGDTVKKINRTSHEKKNQCQIMRTLGSSSQLSEPSERRSHFDTNTDNCFGDIT